VRYITNDRNQLSALGISATNTVASRDYVRTDTTAKAGGGVVSLSGDYTGTSDIVLDVEIVDDGGTTRRVSAPEFSGVGNGVMSDLSAAGTVDAQTFVVTLEDLGTETRFARLPFQSATLVAVVSGDAGNDISLSVDSTSLTTTATDFAVQVAMSAGSNDFIGDEWNFGAVTLNPDGTVPATAPRIRFGMDPQVYRPYRQWRAGAWHYGFSPAPVRSVAAGTVVYAVSGTHSISITNGTTTDTLTGIVTLYDALTEIRDNATLVTVEGAIVNDLRPGGQGITELSVQTRPYVATQTAEGTEYIKEAVVDVSVGTAAPTEVLTIKCTSAAENGAETWTVRGQVSGLLGSATTAAAFNGGAYGFTIPTVPAPPTPPASTISTNFVSIPRSDPSERPTVCVEDLIAGALAKAKTYRFTYRIRPAECDCAEADIEGGPNSDYLGVAPEEVDSMSEASRIIRVQRLTSFIRSFVRSNTGLPWAANSESGDPVTVSANGPAYARYDIELANAAARLFAKGLDDIAGGDLSWPAWDASTAIAADVVREPTVSNGYRYAYSGGTTGGTEPTWPTTEGATVADGTGTWTNLGAKPYALWDEAFTELQQDLYGLRGRYFGDRIGAAGGTAWAATTAYDFGIVVPTTRNGHAYTAETSGTSGASQPTWPTTGGTVTDGSVVWRDLGAYWTATTAKALGDLIHPYTGRVYVCTTAGTTGASEPSWAVGQTATVTDGSVVWTPVNSAIGADSGVAVSDTYLNRYTSALNDVRAAAGISPDFEGAGLDGNNIWRDHGLAGWFESEDGLLPLQPGYYYHSARMLPDEFGELRPVSTQEFGLGVDAPCQPFVDGDALEIIIDLAGVPRATYQQGDVITVQVNRATPMVASGGQTGDDTLTWTVIGDADGRLADYALDLTALAGYSDSGLAFEIAPGTVPFALGDAYTFRVEGARAQWRIDGGSWTGPVDVDGLVSLSSGLSAVFTSGAAPSWVTGDRWTFAVRAANGAVRSLTPTGGRLEWSGSTVIQLTPENPADVDGILFADHAIPADAVITLTGSDDGFATTPLSKTITWSAWHLWMPIATPRDAYRISVDTSGSVAWVFAGTPFEAQLTNGNAELGRLTRRYRLPGLGRRAGHGVSVEHAALAKASVDELLQSLGHACSEDRRTLAVLIGAGTPEPALVRVTPDSIDVADTFGHQPQASARLLSLSMELEAAP
jgi:hypothetical protein